MGSLNSYFFADVSGAILVSVAAWATIYPLGLAIYRLMFSKLAGFPGPRLAAATGWYEFYYDVACQGKYIFEIKKMHARYGS